MMVLLFGSFFLSRLVGVQIEAVKHGKSLLGVSMLVIIIMIIVPVLVIDYYK